ncbi:TPR repeat [Carpediemonas membranifera]|uniref:TPR repeat n=1 Tax=Carpediemonas membranifera TaxID=201153 RepID=A0A8J6BXD6_9EUKA|nr:TPR repeat [Carpediemonas membranifera]|eukprot:KAG9393366.1 TPR repeat [Carpediemonas membranifera]
MDHEIELANVEEWLVLKFGMVPNTSLGWFRAGVGFYNKKRFTDAIACFRKAISLDKNNFNAYQILARACIATNRRDEAISALKEAVKLNSPADWQLLVELTEGSAAPETPPS